jgi:K+-sensing histidine kinase KdpD
VPPGVDDDELQRRLAEVDALRRRVLNVIPHALRTPITTLRGLVEALPVASEEEIREQIAPALQRLAAQAEHLLDDMLIAAGYSTALPTGDARPTPVAATARQVWDEVGGGAPLEIDDPDGAAIVAPEGSLFKMFVHVLDNAAKHGEPPFAVSIADAGGGRTRIAVRSGGTTPTDLAMLTEPFYRSEAAVMRASGLGVGLTVAGALAVQAGGSLQIEAGEDGGVVCRLELPTAAPVVAR